MQEHPKPRNYIKLALFATEPKSEKTKQKYQPKTLRLNVSHLGARSINPNQ